jgi:ATP-dependent Clp protease, protease subunit
MLKFNDATPRQFKAARKENVLEILAYDVIGRSLFDDGVTAAGVAAQLKQAGNVDAIHLRINSPGGDPFEALAIKNLLDSKNIPVSVFIDGEAASAATILMLAGKTITMGEGTMLMLHNAWTFTAGNAAELRKTADDLDKVSGEMRKLYATRTGLPEDQLQAIMDKETFLTAEESVQMKFADDIAKKQTGVIIGTMAVKVTVDTSELTAALSETDSSISKAQFEHEMAVL